MAENVTPDLDTLTAEVRRELAGEFRERLRARLAEQPVEWLVDQLMRRAVSGEPPAGRDDRPSEPAAAPSPGETDEERAARWERVRALGLDEECVREVINRYRRMDRACLEAEGYLLAPPPKGGAMVPVAHRSVAAEALLAEAKDVLFGLLFGEPEDGVALLRTERELLTLTVPVGKLAPFRFLLHAATGTGGPESWRDPRVAAHDSRASDTLVRIEYGEVAGEWVGTAVTAALRLINDLEINERVLHSRTENVEQSSLD